MNPIQMPGRKVAGPGEQAKDPAVELAPDQIAKLIEEDRTAWARMARGPEDKAMVAVKAIDERNIPKCFPTPEATSTRPARAATRNTDTRTRPAGNSGLPSAAPRYAVDQSP